MIGMCQGIFGLFTMYLPSLFPTLLRTTGAGFCYNIGRIAAAMATVFFGTLNRPGDFQAAIVYSSFLFLARRRDGPAPAGTVTIRIVRF